MIRMRVWIRERESASKGILSFKLGLKRERERERERERAILEKTHKFFVFLRKMKEKKLPINEYELLFILKRL